MFCPSQTVCSWHIFDSFFCEAQERLTTRVSSLTKVIVYIFQGQFTARLGNRIILFYFEEQIPIPEQN